MSEVGPGAPQLGTEHLLGLNRASDDLDTRIVRSFAVAAREGSFTRAADRLHLTQQAISNHIKRLEARLGVVLFERRDYGVVLTVAGSDLLPSAEAMLAATERMIASAQGKRYPLRLAEIRSRRMIQEIWNNFRKRWPNSEVSFRDLTSDQQIAALASGQLDIALHPVSEALPNFESCPIRVERVVAIHVDPLPPMTLRQPPVPLGYAALPGSFSIWRHFCERLGSTFDVNLLPVPHDVTMLEAIKQGQLLGEIPAVLALEGMSDYTAAGSFNFSTFDDIQPYYVWSLVWRRGERNPDVLRFIEAAQAMSEAKRWMEVRGTPAWFLPGTEPKLTSSRT